MGEKCEHLLNNILHWHMCSYSHTHTHTHTKHAQKNTHTYVLNYHPQTTRPQNSFVNGEGRAEKKNGSSRSLRQTVLVLFAVETGHKHTFSVGNLLLVNNNCFQLFHYLCWLWSIWPPCYESPPWTAAVHCGWTKQVSLVPDFGCEGSLDRNLHNLTVLSHRRACRCKAHQAVRPRPVNHCGSQPVSKQGGQPISKQAGKPSH